MARIIDRIQQALDTAFGAGQVTVIPPYNSKGPRVAGPLVEGLGADPASGVPVYLTFADSSDRWVAAVAELGKQAEAAALRKRLADGHEAGACDPAAPTPGCSLCHAQRVADATAAAMDGPYMHLLLEAAAGARRSLERALAGIDQAEQYFRRVALSEDRARAIEFAGAVQRVLADAADGRRIERLSEVAYRAEGELTAAKAALAFATALAEQGA